MEKDILSNAITGRKKNSRSGNNNLLRRINKRFTQDFNSALFGWSVLKSEDIDELREFIDEDIIRIQ